QRLNTQMLHFRSKDIDPAQVTALRFEKCAPPMQETKVVRHHNIAGKPGMGDTENRIMEQPVHLLQKGGMGLIWQPLNRKRYRIEVLDRFGKAQDLLTRDRMGSEQRRCERASIVGQFFGRVGDTDIAPGFQRFSGKRLQQAWSMTEECLTSASGG